MFKKNYYVYIITNFNKTVLYTGVTNDLKRRLFEHKNGIYNGFSKRYKCKYLVYYEKFNNVKHAIEREKEIKGWRRSKKEELISNTNMEWKFLNDLITDS